MTVLCDLRDELRMYADVTLEVSFGCVLMRGV